MNYFIACIYTSGLYAIAITDVALEAMIVADKTVDIQAMFMVGIIKACTKLMNSYHGADISSDTHFTMVELSCGFY